MALIFTAQTVVPHYALANPQQGTITHGNANIQGEGTAQMTITQSSHKAVIEWDSFNVGSNERVDFHQPSSSSVTANKVIGTDPSEILGQISATGKLLIINSNGVIFGADSVIDAAAFIATTHQISSEDIMNGDDALNFSGGTASIINNGNLAIRDGGFAALLAPHIVNNGVITARLGQVSLASSHSVSVDFYGDGLLSFAADSDLQTGLANADDALIDQQGQIIADGGVITMTTKAASDIINNAVNIGGLVRATNAYAQDGRIILSADGAVSIANDAALEATNGGDITITAGSLSQGGLLSTTSTQDAGDIDITISGQLSMAGQIDASSSGASGGDITITANQIIENQTNLIDASGDSQGGAIAVDSQTGFISSGRYDASSANGRGGRIDLLATDLRLLGAQINANGKSQGGLVRLGGAFQGGKTPDISQDYYDSFVARWPDLPQIRNAGRSFINDSTHINVSSSDGAGGTAIIWSDDRTTFLGSINASGRSGGSVELSSAATLRYANLTGVTVQDGYLLLDPKNITIGASTELQSWTYQGIIGQWYSQDNDPGTLAANDAFGTSVALSDNGRQLVIGAPGDDDATNGSTNTGAVYLYSFTDDDFGGASLSGIIGDGYTGTGNTDITLGDNDEFGTSVALSGNAKNLAVGAAQDDGNTNALSNSGAVHLFTFTNSSFGGGAYSGSIGSGYSLLNLSNAEADDKIGSSVAFNNDATMLAIGAAEDDGDGNSATNAGAVYLISFSNSSYGSATLEGIAGRGYKNGNNLDLSADIGAGDAFGSAVSFTDMGVNLAVGAMDDDGSSNTATNSGAVYILDFENTGYKNPTLLTTIGSGYTGSNQHSITLANNDNFGSALAFNDDGTGLAVGAASDGGDGDAASASGAVYLLRFNDSTFSTMTQAGTIGLGYKSSGDLSINDLQANDKFGSAIALDDGDRMVVGVAGGDGENNDAADSGMVKLITFTNDSFSGAALSSTITDSAFVNDLPNNTLSAASELFGAAVALNGSGNLLAVSAVYDTGDPSSSNNYGAVHLYSFTDNNYSGAVLESTIGKGYTGGKNINFNASSGDLFAHSVSLNSAGDRLAIGEAGYNSNRGAVYLYSFTDTSFTGGSLAATIAPGATATNDINMTLGVGDQFGASVGLSGDGRKLAVGAIYADGNANAHSNTGEVHLFRFNDADFTGGQLMASIGDGLTSGQDIDLDLATNDKFGRSVSLDYDGNRLAVGASEDAGPDAKSEAGAVYLFSFGDVSFTGGALTATVGDGYTGNKNVNIANLSTEDQFGVGVSLNAIGDRLAVGAFNDDGSGDTTTNSGAVYLLSFSDDDFSTGTVRHIFGSGYNTGNNVDLASLDTSDRFGMAVDLNDAGDRLAVGAHMDDGRFNTINNVGGVYLFSASRASGGYPSDGQSFTNLESSTAIINAYEVADMISRGNNITLQASNDIQVDNEIMAGTWGATHGDLTLVAGRSLIINDHIRTEGGDLTLYANETTANGVVDLQRDSGNAVISLAASKNLVSGSGDIEILLKDGTGKTNLSSGDITLAANSLISGNNVMIRNDGPTAGSDITLASGARISAAASGNALIAVADAFNNSAGASALSATTGRYQLWTTDATGNDVTILAPDFIQYGATYGVTSIAGGTNEDGVFYSNTATVSPDFRTAVTKTYDGTTTATVANADIGVAGANAGESVVLSAGSANFDNKNIGSGKTVSLSNLTIASASRGAITIHGYGLSTTTASHANGAINPKSLTLSGHSAADKTYDRTTGTTASYGTLSGIESGDTVTLDTNTATVNFSDINVGTNKTVTIDSLGLLGADAGNYVIAAHNTTADITAASLTLSSASADNKEYDGLTTANISAYGSLSGVLGADAVSLNSASSSANFDNKNVGTNKTVTISGLALTGANAANYTMSSSATTTANITQKTLSITGPSASNKNYDGDASATITAGTLSGFVGSETVTATATGQFNDANAADGKSVSVTYSLADGTNGGLASNYALVSGSTTANIAPLSLSITAPTAANKTYDGQTSATVTAGALSGLIGAQTLNVTATGTFDTKNVGTGKSVNVAYNLTDGTNGGLASNYALAAGSTTANVTQKALSITAPSATNKTYDGNNNITVSAGTLSGYVGSETLTTTATGTTSDANAGTGKSVTVVYNLADGTNGGLASNYSLANGSASVNITQKTLSITGPTASNKNYDGNASATITAGTLSGFVGSETVTATATGQFNDANAADGKSVSVTYSLADGTGGGLASNYALASGSTTANIAPLSLSIAAPTAANKTYDGQTSATVTAGALSGLIGAQTLNVTATGTFDTKNVGTGKSVNVAYNLTDGTNGGLSSNYALAAGSTTANVTQKALSITAPSATNKTYDGNNNITVSAGTLSGYVGSETLTTTATGTTSDANAGTGKYVTVVYNLADGTNGGLASNYALANGAASVDIARKSLSMSSITAANKTYDGNTNASITTSGLSGFVGSETVTALSQASFSDANAGTNKNISVSFALADGTNGGLASNYQLASVTRQADITAKALTISGTTTSDKTYDASTSATVAAGSLTGLVGSEQLSLSATGTFSSASVGSGKTVSISYGLGNGANGGLAANYSLANETQSAAILSRNLSLSGANVSSKIYDANNTASITSFGTLTNIAGSDDVSLNTSGASAQFNNANAGTRNVTISGLSLTGTSASNYTLTLPSLSGVISQKALQITGTSVNDKAYDGNRDATLSFGTLAGFVGIETVEVDGTALFNNAQPGRDKSVLISYILKNGANGGLSSNYSLNNETLFASIEGRTKEKADNTAPMVEKQVEIVKNDVKIETEEKLEMIEQVELTQLKEQDESMAFVDTVGDWTILTCETTSTSQGMCSAK